MPGGFSEIKKGLSKIEELESKLNLKQHQVNRLLNITQAINNNVSAKDLFEMYRSFLSWEIGVRKMALFIRDEEEWGCASSIGISQKLLQLEIGTILPQFTKAENLNRHLMIHSCEKNNQCQICNKTFTAAGNLNQHLSRTNSGEKKH